MRHFSNNTSLLPILASQGHFWAGTLMEILAQMHLKQLLTNMRLIEVS